MQKSIDMKRTESAKGMSKSKGGLTRPEFVICLENRGNEFSLDVGKIYRVAKPDKLDPSSMLRIFDNEGEDYLYNASQFLAVDLPASSKKRLTSALATAAGVM